MKPDPIRDRLQALAEEHGTITPAIVVADARRKDSPLHRCFEWDIKKAAHKHWLEQARNLIRQVRVVVKNDSVTLSAPFFVRDPRAPDHTQGYVSTQLLRDDSDLARDVIVAEAVRAAAAIRRMREVAAAVNESAAVDGIMNDVMSLHSRVSASRLM